MSVAWLLAFAQWLCGPALRERVFEPLVADWQRQLADAAGLSAPARGRIIAGGGLAFARSLSRCAMTHALTVPPGRALARGALVFAVTAAAMIASQAAIRYVQTRGGPMSFDRPLDILLLEAVILALPLIVPLAMLPVMMRLRSRGRVAGWHAVQCLVAGSVLAFVAAGWVTPLMNRPLQDAQLERAYQRSIANDRTGRHSYPGSAIRQLRPTTPEQRAQQRVEFRTWPATQTLPEMTRTLRTDQSPLGQSITRVLAWHAMLRAPILALALGVMGWALAGLGRTRVVHAVLWFALAWFAVMLFEGRLAYLGNDLTFWRLPYWIPTVVFVLGAVALQIASRRTSQQPSAPVAPGTRP